jgi:hypothetical protein
MIMTHEVRSDSLLTDRFERARDSLWGQPGFQRRNSTIITQGFSLIPQSTWIVETIRTDDRVAIFLQSIDKDGGQRTVLPEKVCQAIYNQYRSITAKRKSARAKKAAETRKAKGVIPFQKRD